MLSVLAQNYKIKPFIIMLSTKCFQFLCVMWKFPVCCSWNTRLHNQTTKGFMAKKTLQLVAQIISYNWSDNWLENSHKLFYQFFIVLLHTSLFSRKQFYFSKHTFECDAFGSAGDWPEARSVLETLQRCDWNVWWRKFHSHYTKTV